MPPQTTRIANYVTSDTRKLRRVVINLTTADFGQWWLREESALPSAALTTQRAARRHARCPLLPHN
jgi:hypothetical protein